MTNNPTPENSKHPRSIWLRSLIAAAGLGAITFAFLIAYVYLAIIPALPDVESLKNVQYQIPMSVFSQDGKLIAQFGEKKRTPVEYAEIPQLQIQAFLAAEDNRFFEHQGVDYVGLLRAASQLILTGEKRQGGSTITMQVARNFFLTRKKTYTRKLREILLSYKIENELEKQEILALYLNKIYLGHRAYGIEAAANVYYGMSLADLNLAQQAMIAGLPKAPSRYNPLSNPSRALIRRNYILGRMLSLGYINDEAYQLAANEPISAEPHPVSIELEAPYVAEMVRNEMQAQYGDDIYTNGIQVYTTLDSRLQEAANRAVRDGLHDYDRRHGYRGILGHTDLPEDPEQIPTVIDEALKPHQAIGETIPALVLKVEEKQIEVAIAPEVIQPILWEQLKWAQPYISETRMGQAPSSPKDILAPGDVIRVRWIPNETTLELSQVPQAAGAFAAIRPFDGSLKALVGGYDFFDSKFNRATQTKRQPGSGFKPFLYLTALENGYTPATLINDAPVVFDDAGLESQWRPENYSGKFFGPTRMREALTHSRNLVSIRILRDIGANRVIESSKRFLFNPDDLPNNLSLALGSGSANPMQMATSYAILANGGYQIKPHFIDYILNRDGSLLYQAQPLYACSKEKPCPAALEDWQLRQERTRASVETVAKPDEQDAIIQTTSLENTPSEPNTETLESIPEEPETPPDSVYAEQVISPQVHYQITSMLQNVVQNGTARRARSLGRNDLAGKTGTTNEQRDAWFNGFQPDMAATAWVGFDDSRPLGRREVGGRAALPIWIDFMRVALSGIPNRPLAKPENMVTVLIDPETGERAGPNTSNPIFEVFREAFAPPIRTNNHDQNRENRNPYESKTLQQLF